MSFGITHFQIDKEVALRLKQSEDYTNFIYYQIKKADEALYQSKNNGRFQTTVYSELEHPQPEKDPIKKLIKIQKKRK